MFEGSLVGLAALLSWMVGYPAWQQTEWDLGDFLAGAVGALLPLAVIVGLMRAGLLEETRKFLDHFARGFFRGWTLAQLALISFLAGVGEELLFRGVLQGKLAEWLNLGWGIFLANLLFGLVHCMSWEYFWMTTLMGTYLSIVYLWSDNLLTAMVAHGVYDFLALIYFMRWTADPE